MTINDIQNEIITELASLEEWFDKYEYLIEQGKNLGPLDDRFKVEANLIKGCQSKVWLHANCIQGRMHYEVDSDALITRGMIALVLRALNDQLPQDVVDADLYFIQETGLSSNLSPSRANGLAMIVKEMRRYALAYVV